MAQYHGYGQHQHHHAATHGMGMGMGMSMLPPGPTAATAAGSGPRVCAYHMSPRGCAKGAACTFPHISPPSSHDPYAAAVAAAEIFGGAASRTPSPSLGGSRPCAFYFSPRGCAKGHECGFSHMLSTTPMPYQHIELPATHAQLSGNGIVTGGIHMNTTGGTHPLAKTRMCAYYQSARGCAKGGLCDFSHDAHALAMAALADNSGSMKPKKGQCAFWSSKGCVKGDACDFAHVGPPGNGSAGTNTPTTPISPAAAAAAAAMIAYAAATSSPRLTSSASRTHSDLTAAVMAAAAASSARSSTPLSSASSPSNTASAASSAAGSKPCAYYSTARGCAKGDACDFAHVGPSGAGNSPSSAASLAPTKASLSGLGTATSPSAATTAAAASSVRRTATPPDGKDESTDNNDTNGGSAEVKIVGEGGISLIVKRCLFYNNPRGCSKGDKCDFAHVVGDGNGSDAQLVDGKRVCTYFSTPRGCVKGDACDFVHLRPDGSMATSRARAVPLSTRPCAFFLQPRGCAKGQLCDFSHDFSALASAYAETVGDLWHPPANGTTTGGGAAASADSKDSAAETDVASAVALAAAIAQASLPAGYEPAPDSDDDDEWADDLARIPCRDHWSGYRCLSGDLCRFYHDRDAPRRTSGASTTAASSSSSSSSSLSSPSAIAEGPEGTKKRRTENGPSIAVMIEDKSDEHVKALLYKYMKTAMAVSTKMIAFLKESPDIYVHVRRALADFAFDTLHSSDVFSPSPSPIPSPAPSPTNASGPSLSSSIPTSSASSVAAAAMTQQAAVPGVTVEAMTNGNNIVDPSLQVDITASLSGAGSNTAPPTPSPSPPPSGLNGTGVMASRPSVSEFLTPLRQAHLSRLADLYMTQLMAGQCNLPDAKQSLAFLAASLAATPDPGPASSLTPSSSGAGTSSSSSVTSSSSGTGTSSSSSTSNGGTSNGNGSASNGNHDVFAFDNPYMRNFR